MTVHILYGMFSLDNLAGWNAPTREAKQILEDHGAIADDVRNGTNLLGVVAVRRLPFFAYQATRHARDKG